MAARDPADDIVLWVLRRVVDRMPGFAASRSHAALEVERMARRTWSGQRCYIPKTWPAERDKRRG